MFPGARLGTGKPSAGFLADEGREKIVYDGKRLRVVLERQGFDVNGLVFDALLASYLLDPSESGHSLSDVVHRKMDGSLPSGRRGVRERSEAPPSRGKGAVEAPGPQGGGAEAP